MLLEIFCFTKDSENGDFQILYESTESQKYEITFRSNFHQF